MNNQYKNNYNKLIKIKKYLKKKNKKLLKMKKLV